MTDNPSDDFLAGFTLALSMHTWRNAESAGQCWQCFNGNQGLQHTNGPCRCTQAFKESLYSKMRTKVRNLSNRVPSDEELLTMIAKGQEAAEKLGVEF